MRTTARIAVFLFFSCAAAWPQLDDWQALARLRRGSQLEIVTSNLAMIRGTFAGFSVDAITLRSNNSGVVIPREQVYRVTLHHGHKRNALIGLALGGASGAILGVASPELGSGTCAQSWPACVDGGHVVMLGIGGAVIGAGVGALIPQSPTTIYRARAANTRPIGSRW